MGAGASSSLGLSDSTKVALDTLPDAVRKELSAALKLVRTRNAPARPPHFGREGLLESVESGKIGAVRGSWLVQLEARGEKLARRQDLPPEAFWSAADLRRVVEALGEDYALLFVALSYRCAQLR
jgi:hypothetical protein